MNFSAIFCFTLLLVNILLLLSPAVNCTADPETANASSLVKEVQQQQEKSILKKYKIFSQHITPIILRRKRHQRHHAQRIWRLLKRI